MEKDVLRREWRSQDQWKVQYCCGEVLASQKLEGLTVFFLVRGGTGSRYVGVNSCFFAELVASFFSQTRID